MKMFKKGISPLIATVLIIGFTVALAAIIMTWGTTFSRGMQKTTEATTEEQLACAQEVVIDLSSVCIKTDAVGGLLTLTLKNDGNKDIEKFSVRMYKDAANIATDSTTLVGTPYLSAYDLKTEDVATGTLTSSEVTLVEIIPVIKVGEKELTCAATKDYFGDQNYEEPLVDC